ncbi:MAG: hypothetical protein QM605_01470, partial [Sphingobium sp.]
IHFLLPAALLFVAGCSGSSSEEVAWQPDEDGNIKASSESWARDFLQSHFDANPVCTPFFAMPRDVSVDSEYEQKRMQAFIDAGLVHREGEMSIADPGTGSGSRRVVRYTLTPEGQKSIHPGSGDMASYKMVICYGRRAIGKVEVGPVDQMMQNVEVKYGYALKDKPEWVTAPSINAFYPGLAKWLADREAEGDSEMLGFRDGKWSFDRSPRPEMFDIQQLGH